VHCRMPSPGNLNQVREESKSSREFMPHYARSCAPILGTVLLMGASFLVLFYGAARRSFVLRKARWGRGADDGRWNISSF